MLHAERVCAHPPEFTTARTSFFSQPSSCSDSGYRGSLTGMDAPFRMSLRRVISK